MSKFMRLMVFFDLPVKTASQRRIANDFRKYLVADGFYMIQLSLYGRLCNTVENASAHEMRLIQSLPIDGNVRTIIITEKQYADIHILVGKVKKKDRKINENQISMF